MAAVTTMALVGAAVIGAAASGYSVYKGHQAAENQEEELRRQGQEEADQIRERARRLKGEQNNAFAASGVDLGAGSVTGLLQETDRLAEQDAFMAIRNANSKADAVAKEGDAAAVSGIMNIAGNLLQSGASFATASRPGQTAAGMSSGSSAASSGGGVKKYGNTYSLLK